MLLTRSDVPEEPFGTEADGLVSRRLADGVGSARGYLARVPTLAVDAGLRGPALEVSQAAAGAEAGHAVEAVVAVPGAQASLETLAPGAGVAAAAVGLSLAGLDAKSAFAHLSDLARGGEGAANHVGNTPGRRIRLGVIFWKI